MREVTVTRTKTGENIRGLDEAFKAIQREQEERERNRRENEIRDRRQTFIKARIEAGFTTSQAEDLYELFKQTAPLSHSHEEWHA